MAQRNRQRQPEPRPEQRPATRRQVRQRARDRQRNQRLYGAFGLIFGVVLLLVLIGALAEFVFEPRSAFAQVGDDTIAVREFRQRTLLEQASLENQLVQLTNLEQQFGGGGFFTSQITQIQNTLSDDLSLGISVLNQMINERVVAQTAPERDITVSDEEIDERLREEIAAGQSAVTEAQATSTAAAGIDATATAELFTPTPSPTIDLSSTITATVEPLPTAEPPAPPPLLEPVSYTTGLEEFEDNIDRIAGMSIADYRNVLRYQILQEKMVDEIGADIPTTETQVNARHILLSVDQTLPTTDTALLTDTVVVTDVNDVTPALETVESAVVTADVVLSDALTTTLPTATGELTESAATTDTLVATEADVTETVTSAGSLTDTAVATDSESATAAVTDAAALTDTANLTDTVEEPTSYTLDEALALAQDLRQQLLDGADFATLAAEYSDDPGSAAQGGELGFFGAGQMVAPFEEAAFSLEPGELSEPVVTDFGVHLIEVVERDEDRAKDEGQLQQEQQQAFQAWLTEQSDEVEIERPTNLEAALPRGL